jgi:hypothetical protein
MTADLQVMKSPAMPATPIACRITTIVENDAYFADRQGRPSLSRIAATLAGLGRGDCAAGNGVRKRGQQVKSHYSRKRRLFTPRATAAAWRQRF